MYHSLKPKNKKALLFRVCSFITILLSGLLLSLFQYNSELDLIPVLTSIKNHPESQRTPETFAEDRSEDASKAELIYHDLDSFSFRYTKSTKKEKSFSGFYFPLEDIEIDFSNYDIIEIGINTNLARRIPINLSVQNKKETHQYIRQFIEIRKGQTLYNLPLNTFFTPSSWYNTNKVSQAEIPQQDLSLVEAISFESCQLLEAGIEDKFTINHLYLKKDLTLLYFIIILTTLVLIVVYKFIFDNPLKFTPQVVHVPIQQTQFEKTEKLGYKIIAFLGEHYSNPDFTLSNLTKEFRKNTNEISKIIREETKLTFPKYLNYLRIEEAKRILISGNYKTVSEIGYIVGFNSPSNFIRVFKSQVGTSPKKFADDQMGNKEKEE